jgi:NAD(P)-dependent dehydrogenase (short-subunit alcohol dehydrogenase family)
LTKAVLPYMRAQKSGVIAHFGSVGSWGGAPAGGLYSATKWAISGVTEALYAEVKEFGIDAVVIEPGYFRTGFLNAGAKVQTEQRLKDYDDTTAGKVRAMFEERAAKQAGDIEKGCKVIFDVLTKATGKEIPMRLPLGQDAYEGIKAKCDSTKELLEEWKPIITTTDHEVKYY